MTDDEDSITGPAWSGARDGVAAAGGALLRTATAAIAAVRPAEKPLHPVGTIWEAEVVRHGGAQPSGVPWLDEPGVDRAVVRVSAAIGLPRGWPDIHGIALRILPDDAGGSATGDILFATTGTSRLTRLLLVPTRSAQQSAHTTLLPYRGPRGPLVLGALPLGDGHIELSWATLTGPWVVFATVALHERSRSEPDFDPILHVPPGLQTYSWVRRLREPAYHQARHQRGAAAGSTRR